MPPNACHDVHRPAPPVWSPPVAGGKPDHSEAAPLTPPLGSAVCQEGAPSSMPPELVYDEHEELTEVDVVFAFQQWWTRAVAGGWEDTWSTEAMTEDVTMTDLCLPTPYHIVGRSHVMAYWEAILFFHGPSPAQVKWSFSNPELVEPGVVSASSHYYSRYETGQEYECEGTMCCALRGHRIRQLVLAPVEGVSPSVSIVRQWQPGISIPDMERNMSYGLVASETSELQQSRELALARRLAQEFREARLLRDWPRLMRFCEDFMTEGVEWTDHCTSPHSLRIVGRPNVMRFLAAMMHSLLAPGGTESWDVRMITTVGPGVCVGLLDLSTTRAADGDAYHVAGRLEVTFDGEQIGSAVIWPRDFGEGKAQFTNGGRGEPVLWQGEPLPADIWKQWRKGGGNGSVQLTRPCSHNTWDNVRLKRGWVILRCRECGSQWRQRPFSASGGRCRAFTSAGGCGLGRRCPLLHVHAVKRTVEERLKERAEEAAAGGDGRAADDAAAAAAPAAGEEI